MTRAVHFWTEIDRCESYGAKSRNPPTDEYPMVLSTGRVVWRFYTRTKTGRSAVLDEMAPHAYVEIHPGDDQRDAVLARKLEPLDRFCGFC